MAPEAEEVERTRRKTGHGPIRGICALQELTGQGLLDKGTMQYGYAIDLGSHGTFVVLTTAPSASDPEYATNKEVVDRAATTFKLL